MFHCTFKFEIQNFSNAVFKDRLGTVKGYEPFDLDSVHYFNSLYLWN